MPIRKSLTFTAVPARAHDPRRQPSDQAGRPPSKAIKGRRYWYFQVPTDKGRVQKYVGPETLELLERIAHYKEARDDERERRALVSTLVRSFGLPRPLRKLGILLLR